MKFVAGFGDIVPRIFIQTKESERVEAVSVHSSTPRRSAVK